MKGALIDPPKQLTSIRRPLDPTVSGRFQIQPNELISTSLNYLLI